MQVPNLRSPREKVGGICFFGRTLDKIRLHAEGKLPADYLPNFGKGADERCLRFLRIEHPALAERVAQGGTDEEILAWCFEHGRKLTEDDIVLWNGFISKRGWNDETSEYLQKIVQQEPALAGRSDIQTFFDFIDADEGRK